MALFLPAAAALSGSLKTSCIRYSTKKSAIPTTPEQALLDEILERFDFDVVQEQALVQAVMQQSRFDPNASHIDYEDEDEETTLICPHCLNPPVPPLRDYYMWREGSRR